MTYGFRKDTGSYQPQCPQCGRFTGDDGYCAFTEADPDFVSVFCDEKCCEQYEATPDRGIKQANA